MQTSGKIPTQQKAGQVKMDQRVYTIFHTNLPKISFARVARVVEENSVTKKKKLDKGYKFFHKEFVHKYQGRRALESNQANCY